MKNVVNNIKEYAIYGAAFGIIKAATLMVLTALAFTLVADSLGVNMGISLGYPVFVTTVLLSIALWAIVGLVNTFAHPLVQPVLRPLRLNQDEFKLLVPYSFTVIGLKLVFASITLEAILATLIGGFILIYLTSKTLTMVKMRKLVPTA